MPRGVQTKKKIEVGGCATVPPSVAAGASTVEISPALRSQYPDVADSICELAKNLYACTQRGARGCSPRVIDACGGTTTHVTLEFGRVLDNGRTFSSGISRGALGRLLTMLHECDQWTSMQRWEPVDKYTILYKLPNLGQSCVLMENKYRSNMTIASRLLRHSIESECRFVAAPCASTQVARERILNYSSEILQLRGTEKPIKSVADQGNGHIQGILLDKDREELVEDSKRGAYVPVLRGAAGAEHGTSKTAGATAAAVVAAASNGMVSSAQAQQVHDLRLAVESTVTPSLMSRTAELAYQESGPYDVRARVERYVQVRASSLRDIVEPARSETSLVTYFRKGDEASSTHPCWEYELQLSWVARGITRAERTQRERVPRCVVRLRCRNASELLLSGSYSYVRLATSMLYKMQQLQLGMFASTPPAPSSVLHLLPCSTVFQNVGIPETKDENVSAAAGPVNSLLSTPRKRPRRNGRT